MCWHVSLMNYYGKYGCVHQQNFSSEYLLRRGGQSCAWFLISLCCFWWAPVHGRQDCCVRSAWSHFPLGMACSPHQSFLLLFRARNKGSACCPISGSPTGCCRTHLDQEEVGTITKVTSHLPPIWANLWKCFFFPEITPEYKLAK